MKVVFIPKAGKPSIAKSKDFRPISLLSFLLKTLKGLLDLLNTESINLEEECKTEHAYFTVQLMKNAWAETVRTFEKSLHDKEYTFLDIEGAFNNVNTDLHTVSDIMEAAFISTCTGKNGEPWYEINLLTTKYKISNFRLTRLGYKAIKEAKYLRIILDFKLSWKRGLKQV